MITTSLTLDHSSATPLAAQALTLTVKRAGCLSVSGGRAWITVDGEAQDRVVAPGEPLSLRPGHRLVIEPWRADEPVTLCWRVPGATVARRAPARWGATVAQAILARLAGRLSWR